MILDIIDDTLIFIINYLEYKFLRNLNNLDKKEIINAPIK